MPQGFPDKVLSEPIPASHISTPCLAPVVIHACMQTLLAESWYWLSKLATFSNVLK